MRFTTHNFICLILISAFSCSPKVSPIEDNSDTNKKLEPIVSGVQFIKNPGKGLVMISTTGYGKNENKAIEDGIQRAFEILLFQGLSNFSALNKPMITNRQKIEKENPNIFHNFFTSDSHQQFITTQEDSIFTGSEKNSKGVRISKVLTINYAALRKYMEQIGGVRKFGL